MMFHFGTQYPFAMRNGLQCEMIEERSISEQFSEYFIRCKMSGNFF